MLEGECNAPPLLLADDVVRSVFELGGNRLSHFEVDGVIDIVRSVLTRGSNPVQEEAISSSSSPHPSSSTSFWFLLSSTGSIDYVSEGCLPLLGYRAEEMRQKSAFSCVAIRDHHIVPPILNVGPCTSMSCRLHLNNAVGFEAPFDVTFAKLSTRQLNSEVDKERSATLCVARAVSHGKITIALNASHRITDIENSSEIPLNSAPIISHHISELIAKTDSTVLNTLLEAHQECSAQLTLSFGGTTVGAIVRSVHHDKGIVLHCEVNKIENNLPIAGIYGQGGVPVMSNNDKLTELCTSVFNEDLAHPTSAFSSSPTIPPPQPPIEKAKKQRKPRQKKTKAQPEKDACLKKLLSSRPSDHLPEAAGEAIGDYSYMEMYSASTMSAQPMYMNNSMPPMGYQPSHSSYMPVHPGGEYSMPQPNPMVPWGHPEYFGHPQQQVRVPYANQTQQKGVKRKPTNQTERPNKMPYAQAPQFAFSQAAPGPLDATGMPTMSDDYHLQPMANNLSPYRYSPGSSPYWPAGGRPPSRSEIIRMELRNSLQAKQMANQQRQPPVEVPAPVSNESSQSINPGIGADSLGFDSMDIVLKDADGSLMDAELDTVYDFKLGGGYGFDMDNEKIKCLVMKLLS